MSVSYEFNGNSKYYFGLLFSKKFATDLLTLKIEHNFK